MTQSKGIRPRKKTVHTLETLLAKTEDYGNCMEWTGYYQNKTPFASTNGVLTSVRKMIAEFTGKTVPEGHFVGTTCGNKRCVNPDHLVVRSMKDHASMMAVNVDHTSIIRVAKLHKAAQTRRVLTDDQVMDVMMDSRTTREIANSFGVSKSLICRIKNGTSNRAVTAVNNPFYGLMNRA